MDTNIKNLKLNHAIQLKKLALKSQEEAALLEDIRAFLKRKTEIEQQYHDEQLQLCQQFLAKKKPKQEERAIYRTWFTLLEETVNTAKVRGEFATKIREDFINSLKTEVEEKRKAFIRLNTTGEKIQESLHQQYGDLSRMKQVYDQSEKENQKALTKYEEAQKPPTGTLRKLKFSLTDSKQKVDAARKKYRTASRRSQDSRNEYFLSLESTNAHQDSYYDQLMPFLMKKIDGNFFESFQRHIVNLCVQEKANCNSTIGFMENVIAAANTINRDVDNQYFVAENNAVYMHPPSYIFESFPNDPVKAISVDEVSKIVLSTKLGKKLKRLQEIEAAIAKKRKEIESILKMTQTYENNPNFGKASETQEEVDAIQFALEDLQVEKGKLEKQVKALTDIGVEALNPISSPKKSSSKKHRVIALYDFIADRDTDLTIHIDDIIVVVEDGDEWIKGELKGMTGLFPATYVRPYEDGEKQSNVSGSKSSKARALYDFDGKDEGDLSFKAGDIIEVISKDDEWWEGTLNGKVGVFPMLFVEEEDDDPTFTVTGATIPAATVKKSPSFVNVFTPPDSVPSTMAHSGGSNDNGDFLSTSSTSSLSAPTATLDRKGSKKRASVAPPPVSSSGFPTVLALYDYNAQVDGELSFKKGDYIEVTSKDIGSEAWWEGKVHGHKGQFPKAYVKEVDAAKPTTPKVAKVEAIYAYQGQYAGELTIRVGDVIELISKTVPGDAGGDWWEGRLNGVMGQFPRAYVKEI